jgi:hypothetical protein
MPVSAGPAEMKKKPVPKKGYSLFVMNSDNGIQNFSAQSYGISSTEKSIKEKM